MAVVKNLTPDTLALFRPDAPPVDPGDEVTVRDAIVVGRAWPRQTWEFVTPPEGHTDVGPDDAYVFEPTPEKPAKSEAKPKGDKS